MPVAEQHNKDFKRFRIRPLHYEGSEEGRYDLFFNSIITEFSDSWTPRWSTEMAYGRMDPLSFYSGTSRELTFGFRVVSDDANEAKKNMVKIQDLIKYQYPSMELYSFFKRTGGPNAPTFETIEGIKPFGLIKAPPYFELSFLNLFNSHGINTLRAYINGAIQISPGFQGKEQSQYFSSDFKEIYFSDVTITLRMQVIHDSDLFLGTSNIAVNGQNVVQTEGASHYPYGISPSAAENINSHAVNSDGTPTDQTSPELPPTDVQAENDGKTPPVSGTGLTAEEARVRAENFYPNATDEQKAMLRRTLGPKDMTQLNNAINQSDDAHTESVHLDLNQQINQKENRRRQFFTSNNVFDDPSLDEIRNQHPDPNRR